MYVAADFLSGQVETLSQGQLGQELRNVGTHHVSTDELAEFAVSNKFDKAGGLIQAGCLTVCGEREGSNLDVLIRELLLGCLFGVAKGSDLRVAEGGSRHVVVVTQELGFCISNGFCRYNALCLCHVCQLQLRGDVTDGVNVVNVGAHAVIDVDGTALSQLNAGVLKAKALNARSEADGNHGAIHGQRVLLGTILGFHLNGDIVAVVLHRGGLVTGQELHAELLVLLGNLLGYVLVLIRQDAVHELHDSDVHTVVGQHISKLHADGAGAHNDHGLRCFLVQDLLFIGDDIAAQLNARQGLDHGAGSDDAVIEGNGLTFIIALSNLNGLIVLEGTQTVDLGDLVLLHQVVNALDDARRNLAGTLVGHTEIKGNIAGDAKSLRLVVEGVGNLCILQQRLGGNTAYVEADSAPVLLFNNSDFLSKLSCADGGNVAARARTEYYYVIMFVSHALQDT